MASRLPIPQDELKKILFEAKIVKEEEWKEAEDNAHRRRRGVEEVLIERGFLNSRYLYELISDKLKVPFINLRKRKLDHEVLNIIDEKTARQAKAIPFALEKGKLKVAFVDPKDKDKISLIKKASKKRVEVFMTSYKNFLFASRLYQKDIQEELNQILDDKILKVDGKPTEVEVPIIKIIDAILESALFEQASDVHIEALPDAVVVRFRVDGDLHDVVELPSSTHDALIARIKILSNLRIDEHRVPQDGRFSFKIEDEEESVRVSVLPAFYGEKIVMRMMTDDAQNLSLEDLGFLEHNQEIMIRQVKKPFGMILVVGPTGSGKTTTLYSVLNILNTEEVNISTIEDPIEYGVHRVNQTQTNTKAGYDFANGLRALLRQDPDIIMIGEIRDNDTAQIAVRAGLTGHLVLSTLHTNNASGAPPRLADMGVEPFLVASTLNLVIAQRLVRRICLNCIESFKLTKDQLKSLNQEFDLEEMFNRFKELKLIEDNIVSFSKLTFYKGKGCSRCNGSGYHKRIAVLELLENNKKIGDCIIQNSTSAEIESVAKEQGMITIFEDGMQKVLLGMTTIEEVLRIKRV
ncbi:MAG: type II/IV secretion system protein [Candidatus Komeilibacteria bacterium]|jgi:type IV pilus assembly protein PilB|nr:type II/IV secretion system protein [Candidatus Komeilibacteria bacterium]MBT4447411.1 type II/IV secretion system protein [Candidatus Komeilibacteria bacterium]